MGMMPSLMTFANAGVHGTHAPGYVSIKPRRCRVCKRKRGKREGSMAFLRHILKCEHDAGLHGTPCLTPELCS